MTVIGTDYTFAVLTGDFDLPFGTTADCGGESFRSNCPFFGNAVIDTRGTGMVLDKHVRSNMLDVDIVMSLYQCIQYTCQRLLRKSKYHSLNNPDIE